MNKYLITLLFLISLQSVIGRQIVIRQHKTNDLSGCAQDKCSTQLSNCYNDHECLIAVQNCAKQAVPQGGDGYKQFEECIEGNPNATNVWLCVKNNCLQRTSSSKSLKFMSQINNAQALYNFHHDAPDCADQRCAQSMRVCANAEPCVDIFHKCAQEYTGQKGEGYTKTKLAYFKTCLQGHQKALAYIACLQTNCQTSLELLPQINDAQALQLFKHDDLDCADQKCQQLKNKCANTQECANIIHQCAQAYTGEKSDKTEYSKQTLDYFKTCVQGHQNALAYIACLQTNCQTKLFLQELPETNNDNALQLFNHKASDCANDKCMQAMNICSQHQECKDILNKCDQDYRGSKAQKDQYSKPTLDYYHQCVQGHQNALTYIACLQTNCQTHLMVQQLNEMKNINALQLYNHQASNCAEDKCQQLMYKCANTQQCVDIMKKCDDAYKGDKSVEAQYSKETLDYFKTCVQGHQNALTYIACLQTNCQTKLL